MWIKRSWILAFTSLLSQVSLCVWAAWACSADYPETPAATPAKHGDSWRVGMSAAFSGPAEALGNGMRSGIEGCFKHINDQGGVHGVG